MTIAADAQEQNANTYDALISLIENSQGRLAPIIVACDDWAVRQRIIDQYETEARQAQIQPYRVRLGQEPSVRAALAKLKEEHDYLQQGGDAVFTITGAELLLRVTLKLEEEQSELDKFFGYLQWTREGLREFRYPIVLWVTYRILKEMSRRAPDFWSWRKAVLRFVPETESAVSTVVQPSLASDALAVRLSDAQLDAPSNNFLPPLNELQAEIQQLEATEPTSPNLATLYDQLGQVYAHRVESGTAINLEQEQAAAIAAFQTAIYQYQQLDRKSTQAATLSRLGNFLYGQSRFPDAIEVHQRSLEISREIGDRNQEGGSLCNLGHAYKSLGQYQQAIKLYQQALEVQRSVGNRQFESNSLGGLGNAYRSLGQYQKAIEFHQQALAIRHELGNREGEAGSLIDLGDTHQLLGQYQQSINFHQQSLEIAREIGDRHREAASLNSLGNACHAVEQYEQSIDFHQQSLTIQREIGDRHGEAISLCNLGNAYYFLRQYQKAIDFYQQSLAIKREIGDRYGEGITLGNLGTAYKALEQYQKAINFYKQALAIDREIGDRNGEALSLLNMGNALARLDQHYEALQNYQQALAIYEELKLDHMVEKCKTAITGRNKIIPSQIRTAPTIGAEKRTSQPRQRWWKNWKFWLAVGVAIALLVGWLR